MTKIVRFTKTQTSDPDLIQMQISVAKFADSVAGAPALNTETLTGVVLDSASTTIVSHKLGRRLTGWKVVRLRADSRVWDDQDSNPSPDRTLWLKCSADVTVDLEVR